MWKIISILHLLQIFDDEVHVFIIIKWKVLAARSSYSSMYLSGFLLISAISRQFLAFGVHAYPGPNYKDDKCRGRGFAKPLLWDRRRPQVNHGLKSRGARSVQPDQWCLLTRGRILKTMYGG